MATASQYPTPVMSSWRLRLLRLFLWISVLGWGIGLGAKLFDLLVLAGAWSASPPASLAFLPYGPHFPIHPGNFLPAAEPSDAVGCRGSAHLWMEHPWKYRVWLSIPLVMFLIIWILT